MAITRISEYRSIAREVLETTGMHKRDISLRLQELDRAYYWDRRPDDKPRRITRDLTNTID